jgi:hypothetical protein
MHLPNRGKAMGRSDPLADLLAWLRAAPPGTTIPAASLAETLANVARMAGGAPEAPPEAPPEDLRLTWREKLWLVPAETRLGVRETAEAIGRPRSWVYRRTAEKSAKALLPHRKLDGELVFTAGELRVWVEGHETVVVPALRRSA